MHKQFSFWLLANFVVSSERVNPPSSAAIYNPFNANIVIISYLAMSIPLSRYSCLESCLCICRGSPFRICWSGSKVEEFEEKLSSFLANDYVVTTNYATSAESLIYHMLKDPCTYRVHTPFDPTDNFSLIDWSGLEAGDEVLASPLTCTATNWPIISSGLKLKWVDIPCNIRTRLMIFDVIITHN